MRKWLTEGQTTSEPKPVGRITACGPFSWPNLAGIASQLEEALPRNREEAPILAQFSQSTYAAGFHQAWSRSGGSRSGLQQLTTLARHRGWDWLWSRPVRLLRSQCKSKLPKVLDECRTELDLDGVADTLRTLDIRVLIRGSGDYPGILEQLVKPPQFLYVRGNLKPVEPYAISIVGTRKPTNYGRIVAERLAYELGLHGVCTVSGLAYGIDTAAHTGALRAQARTLAVLGTGIEHIYPRGNRTLGEQLIADGALVSEFPLGQPAARWTFPQRNRIIAALGQGLIVVQAALNSGTRYTVEHALELGRSIFAVPGDIRAEVSAGPHKLIGEGAELVEAATGVLDKLGWSATKQTEADPDVSGLLSGDSDLHRVLALIGAQPITFDQLAQFSELQVPKLQACLLQLELGGAIRQLPGQRFIKV